jgi:hypothetical protein
LSTGSRDGAHYLGRGTQGEPVEIENCNDNGLKRVCGTKGL